MGVRAPGLSPSRLAVLADGPLLDTSDCPRNWTWDEGSDQTLQCRPRGNPKPQLQCLRKGDKAPLHIGDHRPVKEEIQGTYVCRANNSQGVVTAEVVLTVNCEWQRLGVGARVREGWGRAPSLPATPSFPCSQA